MFDVWLRCRSSAALSVTIGIGVAAVWIGMWVRGFVIGTASSCRRTTAL
jgi:peptide deformylase